MSPSTKTRSATQKTRTGPKPLLPRPVEVTPCKPQLNPAEELATKADSGDSASLQAIVESLNTTPPRAEPLVTNEQISKRAYEIWIEKGRPYGQDAANWAQAVAELSPQ